jgi:capsular polysaccharide transport system permease protein
MSTIVVFAIIKELLHSNAMPGIDYPVFLASGFVAYNMFKNIVFKSMNAFAANKGLYVYKQVKPFDTIIARAIVEISITGIVTLLFLFIGWYLGLNIECKNILLVIVAYLWLALFGVSIGILFAVLSFFYENFGKIINLLFLPLFFMSALFYTIDSLPPIVGKILLFNPIVNFMEMIHGNYFYGLNTDNVNYIYMLLWTLFPLFLGLWLYEKAEKKIIMS